MIYGDVADYLSTFIDCEETNELFNYESLDNNLPESYKSELHKFNYLYKCYFFNKNRLAFMINNYEIILKKEDLNHLMKIYLYYKENNKNNSYLIAEFLLSYYNTISNKGYAKNVSNAKKIKKDFKETLENFSEIKNPILDFCNDSYELYNMIIDYGIKQKDCFFGDIIDRACSNLQFQKEKKQELMEKLLKNQKYLLKVIEYDEEIEKNVSFYEQYIKSLLSENLYYQYPEIIIYELDKINKLKKELLDLIINNIIEKINILQDRSLKDDESIIQILAEIDELIGIINRFLNKIKNKDDSQSKKLNECINNILYIKRMVVSNDEKIRSQMQEFKYEKEIPNGKIEEFVELVSNNIGLLYTTSCGNFIKKLEDSLNTYSQYPISYMCNSFNIDSEKQVYSKADENIEESVFKDYYDLKGKEYTESHPYLQNKLGKDYYKQMLKHMRNEFLTEQHLILSFFDMKRGNKSLMNLLISKGEYSIKNSYVLLAMNVIQIEHTVIEILDKMKKEYSKNGANNLNELAKEYVNDPIYFNGLMYINYILYEKHGLDIRNNISHGNYFNKNVEVELLTTYCAIMFLNNIHRKECGIND